MQKLSLSGGGETPELKHGPYKQRLNVQKQQQVYVREGMRQTSLIAQSTPSHSHEERLALQHRRQEISHSDTPQYGDIPESKLRSQWKRNHL